MKPPVGTVLQKLAIGLISEVGPALPPGYLQSSMMVSAMLLQCAGEELDRAAARRVEENAALRALFADAAATVDHAALRERLAAAAAERDASLLVSDLDAANSSLRALLIELHVWAEEQPGDDANRIDAAIWHELRAATERRALSVAPF